MTPRRFLFASIALLLVGLGLFALYRFRVASERASETESENAPSSWSASGSPSPQAGPGGAGGLAPAHPTGTEGLAKEDGDPSATANQEKGGAPPSGEGLTGESREKARDERRKKARAALEDFLRDELRMNEEQVQAYKDIQSRHDAQLKAARESNQERAEKRAAMRAIFQDQSQQLRELVGDVDYARIQDFQRRQREQYREEHPDSWDGRPSGDRRRR